MKFSNTLLGSAIATAIPGALAHPGAVWRQKLAEIERRGLAPIDSPEDSNELLGDLITPGPTTPVGKVGSSKDAFRLTLLTVNSFSRI
jgi:hypothetical protein